MLMILDPSLPWGDRRVVRYSEAIREALGEDRFSPRAWAEGTAPVPDLGDPATLGCLLALVREAWTSPHASVLSPKAHDSKHSGLIGKWVVRSGGVLCFAGASEPEALVAALEATP